MLEERNPLPALTSLRFLAAASVVLYNSVYLSSISDGLPRILKNLMSGGFEAVSFFFILSGFILTYVYSRAIFRPSEFWRSRAARLLPLYYLGLAIAVPQFLSTAIKSSLFPTAILTPLLQQAWWQPSATAWNAPAWSLSVEVLFYALFPFILPLILRANHTRVLIGSYVGIVTMALLQHMLIKSAGIVFWSLPLFHLPLFTFGIALGRMFLGIFHSRQFQPVMYAVGSVATILLISTRSWLPDWALTNPVIAPLFGLIIFGAAKESAFILGTRIMLLLGNASYAMYILHMPIYWIWTAVAKRLDIPAMPGILLYLAIVIATSIAAHLYIELPAKRSISQRAATHKIA